MYRQHTVQPRALRSSWDLLESTQELKQDNIDRVPRSQGSEPITIFSVAGSDRNAASGGILPRHDGKGLFHGFRQDDVSLVGPELEQRAGSASQADAKTQATATSLGSVLEEVLDSVDAATELHLLHKANSRIEEWLGHQSELHTDRKRPPSKQQTTRMQAITKSILRDLLGVDKSVLNLLFHANDPCSDEQRKIVMDVEARLWRRWKEVTRTDTVSISHRPRPVEEAAQSHSQNRRGNTLERIPWGIPEETADEEYWNEELSIPMIFRYLKSYFSKPGHSGRGVGDPSDEDAHAPEPKHQRTAMSTSTRTQTATVIAPSIAKALPSHAASQASALRNTARSSMYRSRLLRGGSRTSRSSSYKSVSLRTGSCSIASMRPSALGSNFWDIGSLGGTSGHGNWSLYA